jgi:hypothetical protein
MQKQLKDWLCDGRDEYHNGTLSPKLEKMLGELPHFGWGSKPQYQIIKEKLESLGL